MKRYLIEYENGVFKIEERTHPPESFVTDKFDGQYCLDVGCFDIEDRPEGKVAVFSQSKADAKKSQVQAKQAQEEIELNNKIYSMNELKVSLPTFDSKTAAEKWALVKKLIEVL